MDLNISNLLQMGTAVAALFAAYTPIGAKATMLELKLWVTENFERRKAPPVE